MAGPLDCAPCPKAMSSILDTLKSIVLWTYSRKSLQYDVLCALILAFIFLTPKGWFETSELRRVSAHPSPFARILLVEPEPVSAQPDKAVIEQRVRQVTNRPETEVTAIRAQRDAGGKIVAYEVDIR